MTSMMFLNCSGAELDLDRAGFAPFPEDLCCPSISGANVRKSEQKLADCTEGPCPEFSSLALVRDFG